MIWKTQGPTKVYAFMWLLAKHAILTWDNLQRKEWVQGGAHYVTIEGKVHDIYLLVVNTLRWYGYTLIEEGNID